MFIPLCMFTNILKKYHIFYIKLLTYVNNGVNLKKKIDMRYILTIYIYI